MTNDDYLELVVAINDAIEDCECVEHVSCDAYGDMLIVVRGENVVLCLSDALRSEYR